VNSVVKKITVPDCLASSNTFIFRGIILIEPQRSQRTQSKHEGQLQNQFLTPRRQGAKKSIKTYFLTLRGFFLGILLPFYQFYLAAWRLERSGRENKKPFSQFTVSVIRI